MAERHVGAFVDRRHAFGDSAALEQLIAEGEFHDVHVESVTCRIRFAESTMFVRLNSNAVVGMGVPPSTMSDDERNRLADLIAEDAADVVRPGLDSGDEISIDRVLGDQESERTGRSHDVVAGVLADRGGHIISWLLCIRRRGNDE